MVDHLNVALVAISCTLSAIFVLFLFILTVSPRTIGMQGVSKVEEPASRQEEDLLFSWLNPSRDAPPPLS